MRVDLFDFDLPDEAIALKPARPRDSARLLAVNPHHMPVLSDHYILDLVQFLRPGDALVFNDTKVIPAQLSGARRRKTADGVIEAKISLTLHLREAPDRWRAFARPAKKLIKGDRINFDGFYADVVSKNAGGDVTLEFSEQGGSLDAAIAAVGDIPLPPYIAGKRKLDDEDLQDYQTIYASTPGAVAAPTAGLHTTQRLLEAVTAIGCHLYYLTLHVGAGTFLPVKSDDTSDHKMHSEIGIISAETAYSLNEIRQKGGRIIAIGTTSLRLLESSVDGKGQIKPFCGETDIFIKPGDQFRAVDMLMTNFHLPRSTLFMLVSAFAGLDVMRAAYDHAIRTKYRFFSYGDASLLWRADMAEHLR